MATVRKRTWHNRNGEQTAWVADYFDQEGRRHIKTFDKQKDVKAWLDETKIEVERGVHTPERDSITVSEAAEIWLQKCELEKLERSTLRQYRGHVDHYIKPSRIGADKLARLSTPAIEAFRDDLLKANSRAMTRKVLASLKSILGEAQRRGLVAQNAAQPVRVDIRRSEKSKLRVGRDLPSKEEVNAILEKAEGRWRPLLVTAIFTGLRSSELRGLTWDDVDFERRVIHVRRRANLWGEMGAPKSAAGEREIPMAPMVANTLREWKLACPKGDLSLVFPDGNGNVEYHSNIIERGLKPLQPKYGLHAYRHFFASWLIERGFSPKRVQALMGHSSIQMTFDVYGHLFPSLEDDHAKFEAGERALVGV